MDSEHEKYVLTESNNDRINFLYSPFPKEKTLNPKHWDSKIQFWIDEILKSCRFYNEVCINLKKLQTIFQQPGNEKRIPKGKFYVRFFI